jgi:hypothetical protein
VIFTSPNTRVFFKTVAKKKSKIQLWMPNWTLSELLYAAHWLRECGEDIPPNDEITYRAQKYGNAARICFATSRWFNMLVEHFKRGLGEFKNASGFSNLITTLTAKFSDKLDNHRFLSFKPMNGEGNYPRKTQVEFASLYVASEIYFRFDKLKKEDRIRLIVQLKGVGDGSILRGLLYEQYCHEILTKGGTFDLIRIKGSAKGQNSFLLKKPEEKTAPDKELMELVCSGKMVCRVDSLGEQENIYRAPKSKTFPGIDGVYRDQYAFQITVNADGHDVSYKGLKAFGEAVRKLELWKENPAALKLVFVVPQDVAEVYLKNKQTIALPKQVMSLIDIPGVGAATVEKLEKINITSVAEFIQAFVRKDDDLLRQLKQSKKMLEFVRNFNDGSDEMDFSFMEEIPQYVLVLEPKICESWLCPACSRDEEAKIEK